MMIQMVQFVKQKVYEHRVSLLILSGGTFIMQIITLIQSPFSRETPDSPSYLRLAQHIWLQHQFADLERTPGYSTLLAGIMAIAGKTNFNVITIAQIILTLLTIGEIYILTYRLTGLKWFACTIATLCGTNLFFLNWERAILTECLSWWVIVTVFYMLERFIHTDRWLYLVLLTASSAFAILVRPFFIFVPLVIALVLLYRALRLKHLRKQALPVVLSLLVVYGIVVGDMANNKANKGYFGLTIITNINLFGKVLEYHMEDGTANPRFHQLRIDAHKYVASGNTEPFRFTQLYPQDIGTNYSTLGAYSLEIIEHHPTSFLSKSIKDMAVTLVTRPHPYAPFSFQPFWVLGLLGLDYVELLLAYLALPFVLVWLLITLRRQSLDKTASDKLTLFSITAIICIIGDVILAAVGSYQTTLSNGTSFNEFYRMRFPFDWAMILLAGIMLYQAYQFYMRRRAPQGTSSEADLDTTLKRSAVASSPSQKAGQPVS